MTQDFFDSHFWERAWNDDPYTSLKKMKKAGLGSYDSPGFEQWARNYDRQSFTEEGQQRSERIIKWIEQQIPTFENLSILDVGAASGSFSIPFAKRGAQVTALEPSPLLSELLQGHAESSNLNINIINENFENCSVDELGQYDLVFASMCPAVTDWQAVQKALNMARRYFYVSLMAGPKENQLVDEIIETFNLEGHPTTADMYYLLQLLFTNNYTYQSLIEYHHNTKEMSLETVMTQLPTWLSDFDITLSDKQLQDVQQYLQKQYGDMIPVTTGGKFGKVLVHKV